MEYININLLQKQAEPRLIFEANLDISKGKSNKTYSIKLPDTSYNNTQLDNLFGKYIGRRVSFPAKYTIEGVTLTGVLLITDVENHEASATFITGNGVVWDAMQSDTLQDIDFSDYDVILNKANVLASESAYPMVVFDLTDRGAFKGGETAIDITDRFPALNVKQLLIELFTAYGFYLDVTDNTGYFDELYLLFTGSDEIRNDADWLQNSVFEAEAIPLTKYTDYGTNTQPVFEIYEKLQFHTEITDKGENYDNSSYEYTVPQTGTYAFIYDYYLYIERPNIATVSGLSCSIRLFVNGVAAAVQSIDVTDLTGSDTLIRQGTYNARPTEYEAGDIISMYIYFSGTISSVSRWTVRLTQYKDTSGFLNKFYVVPSRWYGAGSTVEVTKILPPMVVSDFLKQTLALLNADVYFNENTNAVSLVVGYKQAAPVAQVEVWNYAETLEDKANTILQFKTDKARPQPNKLIKIVGAKDTVTSDISYSRTLIAPCTRLFTSTDVQIPVLWQAEDPLDFSQADTPPERKTTANLRILRKAAAVSGSYLLSYGGVLASNSEVQSTVLQMQEVDVRSLHIQSCSIERKLIQCNAKLDVSKLYDNTYFKNEITVVDRRNSVKLLNGQLVKAEQIEFDIYKLTLYPTAQEQIDPSVTDWFTPVDAQGGSGGGSSSTAYVAPADMWQSSVAGQIEGLTPKTTLVDADDFVIDDSAESNAKKKFSWSAMKTNLSSFFYGAFTGQLNGTTAKTSLSNDDVFVIEDSASSPTAYAKKSVKWSTIRAILNNIYYSAIAGQFAATTEKTSIVANDLFIIEDSAASNAKKSLKYSTIKTALDSLYGFWSAVTGGIRTNSRVGINVDPGTGTAIKVSDSLYGVDAKSTGNGGLRSEIEMNADYSFAPVIELYRTTTSTAAAGIGMIMPFYIQNASGSNILAAYIQTKLTNATAGSEKAEFAIYVNSAIRFKINEDNDIQISSGSDLKFLGSGDGVILKSPGGTSYRVTVDNSGNLITTAI